MLEAHGALTRPRGLADHEIVAAGLAARAERLGEGLRIPVVGHPPAKQLDQGRGPVEVIVQRAIHARDVLQAPRLDQAGRRAHDERHARRDVVRGLMVAPDVELALVLAVIRADDDERVVQHPGLGQRIEQIAHVRVGIADARVVAVDPAAHRLHRIELLRQARVLPQQVGQPAGLRHGLVRLLRGVRPKAIPAALAHLLGQPRGQRIVLEGVAELRRRAVGRVRIPVVDVQEPVIRRRVALEPFQRGRRHIVRQLHAAEAGVVDLAPARMPPPGGVPLPEGADAGRIEARGAQLGDPARAPHLVAEAAVAALVLQVRGDASVVDRAVMIAEPAGVQRGARGQARRIRHIAVLEPDALRGDPVEVGAGVPVIAVAAQVVGSQGVDVDIEDAGHGVSLQFGYVGSYQIPMPSV
ncbi:MAG: hypothetical protein BWY52_03287 [Chloroflexi bacterium ADurb.Bin325]|nr:MAG: hypothetical protein BWY52_03287 [Chloroflexi bacterium ADurb.Bin325]